MTPKHFSDRFRFYTIYLRKITQKKTQRNKKPIFDRPLVPRYAGTHSRTQGEIGEIKKYMYKKGYKLYFIQSKKEDIQSTPLLKCAGTLRVIFWNDGQHTFSIINGHSCMIDGEWSDGKEKDERLSMTVVAPSINWNFTEQHLLEMKSGLVSLTDARWSNLQGCRLERQYLPELSTGTTKQMTDLRKRWKN